MGVKDVEENRVENRVKNQKNAEKEEVQRKREEDVDSALFIVLFLWCFF